MIIADTNVLSEVMRPAPDPRVSEWLRQNYEGLHLSVVTIQELTFGVARLPDGARRTAVEDAIAGALRGLRSRSLPITAEIARVAGGLLARRLTQGQPISMADAQIAATALVHSSPLATRNVRDFEGLGLDIVNPWGDDRP